MIVYAYLILQEQVHLFSDTQSWTRVSRGLSLLSAIFVRHCGWIDPEESDTVAIHCAIQCPRMSGGMGKWSTEQCFQER